MTQPSQRRSSTLALVICTALLSIFGIIAWLAVSTKSPTYDEVYHAAAAWTHLRFDDFRIDCEDPPLWKFWAALPNGPNALKCDFSSPTWKDEPQKMYLEWWWCVRTLFETPGNHGDTIVNRSRAMMLVFGVLLGALIGWWAWRIKGAVAAIVATFFFALDPNFLGHSALVKNDVIFCLSMLGMMYAIWRAGQKLTWTGIIAISFFFGVMLTVKFSGVLGAPLIVLCLAIRALLPGEWLVWGRTRNGILSKTWPALTTACITAIVGYISIWAAYGFRFSPTPDPKVLLNTWELVQMAKHNELASHHAEVTEQMMLAQPVGLKVKLILIAEHHHLLPQAWLAGLLYTYQSTLIRKAFLAGNTSITGWWYYFPFAMLVKTPVATLLAGFLCAIAGFIFIRSDKLRDPARRWTLLCLFLPVCMYMASAMRSHLNIGLRHVLPVYPFLFIAMGWIAAEAWQRWGRRIIPIFCLCGALLMVETLTIFPDYIAFFNFAAGGERNGINLLADSNLDWGQDLPLLVKWQKENPDMLLYLSYFGLVDPQYYQIRYVPLIGGFQFDKNPTLPTAAGVIAASASNVQGVIPHQTVDPLYITLRQLRPIKVLGGSIYLYRWPPQPGDYLSRPDSPAN